MSGRYMKYAAIIAVAVVSFLLAIPLSRTTAQQPTHLTFKPVAHKVVSTPVIKPTVTHIAPAVAVAQPIVYLASYRCAAYQSYFEQYDWSVDTAMAICEAESSGNPYAVSNGDINPDGVPDYGLMQLHGVDIIDPAANISYAYYHKYLTQGWEAWSTYNSGAYTKSKLGG